MRLIGMSTGSALPDCSPARIGPCDSLWMFLVTTTTNRRVLSARFLVDVLSDDNYENDFEIVENAYAPPPSRRPTCDSGARPDDQAGRLPGALCRRPCESGDT